jgi:hypothetical protein
MTYLLLYNSSKGLEDNSATPYVGLFSEKEVEVILQLVWDIEFPNSNFYAYWIKKALLKGTIDGKICPNKGAIIPLKLWHWV